ncbi:MAG: excinuclease ABC subunit UvrC [Spirochaetes bacterium]|nr:MAG: excinuclease ABC subunit UvrC [Spirochaetota bacterium]
MDIPAKLASLPDLPGVYIMKDASGLIIYVGKASSLKKRVSSYFQKGDHDVKTRVLVKNIDDLEYIVTDSEIEALLLESALIKKHKPKYNIRLKDDKRYPYIAVTLSEEYPRVVFTRRIARNGNRYFGPYTDARAARGLIGMLNTTFKLKTCAKPIPLPPGERPCLNFQMKRCSGLCVGRIDRDDYLKIIDGAIGFLEGNVDPTIGKLSVLMQEYAHTMQYEKAAGLRDIIADIRALTAEQKVSAPVGTDQDLVAVTVHRGEGVLVLMEFRAGALLGRKVFIFENAEYSTPAAMIQAFLLDYYRGGDVPPRIVVPEEIEDRPSVEAHLSSLAARKVVVSTPKTQDDRGVISLIRKNIDVLIADRDSARESGDRAKGLDELRDLFALDDAPSVIECFDISNTQGTNPTASMVRFRDGAPEKSGYRRFRIRGFDAPDDPGMIHEVVSRRIQHLLNEGLELPELMVIDGGPTQLRRAVEARDALGADIRIISLAKRFEEIYSDSGAAPLRLPPSSTALRILQQIRDEAHRFAVTYHRKLRDASLTRSFLDEVPGVGDAKKRLLLKNVEVPERIKEMSVEELAAIPGLGKKAAADIYRHFHREVPE